MREKLYLVFSTVFLIPPILLAVFIYLPGFKSAVVTLNILLFSVVPAGIICEYLLNNSKHSLFAYCGPDVIYLKLLSVIMFYVLPATLLLMKYLKLRKPKSKWK